MKNLLIYDLPTRLFHWIFAGLFIGALAIAKLADDESSLYPYHMLMGILMAAIVLLRILWGVVGSRYARFSSFRLKPRALMHYLKDIILSKTAREAGHNPASSWAAITMFVLALGLAFTGMMMAQANNKDLYEDVHELLANAFMITAIAHAAGVIFHALRHKDGIALSMINGRKQPIKGAVGIKKNYRVAGIVFLMLIATFAIHLGRNYDPVQQNLKLFGTTLQLGESDHSAEHLDNGLSFGHEERQEDDAD